MMVIRFRDKEEHGDLMQKVRTMKKFTEELERMLAECYDDDLDYRGGNYRREYDEGDMRHYDHMQSRYGYRGGRM